MGRIPGGPDSQRQGVATVTFLFLLSVAFPAWGQDSNGIGVVTALSGSADLARPQVPTTALKRRDHLFVRDVIDTHEASRARILLMGKSAVTVRELSRFEIREEVGPGPGQRALIDLLVGKIRVMVARRLMTPGDEVDIRTPNVFAGVRGTDGIFEVTVLPDGTTRTVVTGISGEFEVRLPHPRSLTAMAEVVADAGPPLHLAQVRAIRIRRGDRLLVDPAQVVKSVLSPAELEQLIRDFGVSIAATGVRPGGQPAPVGIAVGQRTRTGDWPLAAKIGEAAQSLVSERVISSPVVLPTTAPGNGRGQACVKAKGKVPFCL